MASNSIAAAISVKFEFLFQVRSLVVRSTERINILGKILLIMRGLYNRRTLAKQYTRPFHQL